MMSIEAYLDTLPSGERLAAEIALKAHCRDKQGNECPVYHSVEEYIAAGWSVGRPNGRGVALVHAEAGEHIQDKGLGYYGMGYAEWLSMDNRTIKDCAVRFGGTLPKSTLFSVGEKAPKEAKPKRKPRKRKAK